MSEIPILELRRIEANVIKPIYEEMALEIGHEKAEKILAGGNTKYTAGAMRFCFDGLDSLRDLLKDPEDERLEITDFGSYTESKFAADLLNFNNGRSLSE